MNPAVEKVKIMLGVSEIEKNDGSLLLGSKEKGIICRMSLEEENCVFINVRTPKREVSYYPVNSTIPETIGTIHNMIKSEPSAAAEAWYENELKKLQGKPAAAEKKAPAQGRKPRRRRGNDPAGKAAESE